MVKARGWSEEEKQWLKDNLRYDSETGDLLWTTPSFRGPRKRVSVGTTHISNGGYLTFTMVLRGKKIAFRNHRVVWFLNYGYVPEMLDHIDGDRLNNRVENLRPATHSLNSRNRGSFGKIKYKGVYLSGDKYRCRPNKGGKLVHVGVFDTAEEAARAYDKFVEEELTPLERQFAKTNEEMGLYDND